MMTTARAEQCAICHKPQPCPRHGRTPVTDADWEELHRDTARSNPIPPIEETAQRIAARMRYRVMDDRPCSQCGAPLIWDNVCRGAACLFCLHQAFAACTCDEVDAKAQSADAVDPQGGTTTD